MRDLLAEIVEHKRLEIIERKRLASQAANQANAAASQTDAAASQITPAQQPAAATPPELGRFAAALSGSGVSIIAEVKPKSPSAGELSRNNLDQVFSAYGQFAQALSVLTDHKYFAGSLELLRTAAASTGLPVLCKDFFIDEFQVYEAQAAGADAILLIVKILGDELLSHLHQLTLQLGMTPVVEVQNISELTRALAVDPQVLLINNRDLTTFEISFDTTKKLAARIPPGVIVISASGIESRKDIDLLLPYARRFLIGSSVMRSADPAAKLKELLSL